MQTKTSNLKKLPILLIRNTHYAVLLFVVFGWVFSKPAILVAHLLVIPLVILQWKVNQGRCILTDLEHRLLPNSKETQSEGFVNNLIQSVFKVQPTERQLMLLMYTVMAISFLISATKLFFFNGIL